MPYEDVPNFTDGAKPIEVADKLPEPAPQTATATSAEPEKASEPRADVWDFLTGRTRYRQSYWRRRLILQVEAGRYATHSTFIGEDENGYNEYRERPNRKKFTLRWRDATLADLFELKVLEKPAI